MKISLIIAVYKNIDFLDLVLQSVARQRLTDFEVIIAEDNDAIEMKEFISQQRLKYSFSIHHANQPHDGFGKNCILNKAIKISQGEYLAFIDGDCVLHKNYLREFLRLMANDNMCLFGRRVGLDEKITKQLIQERSLRYLNLLRILFSSSRRREDALYIPFQTSNRKMGVWGCSFFLPRKLILDINGFDEDFTNYYFGEDNDIERRLRLIGVRFKCTRQKTIQYHLFHARGDDAANWKISKTLYEKKVQEGLSYCNNGLIKKSPVNAESIQEYST